MNGMWRVSHAVGGGSNPGEGWDTPCSVPTPPVLPVGQLICPRHYSIVAKGVVRWPEGPGSIPGGGGSKCVGFVLWSMNIYLPSRFSPFSWRSALSPTPPPPPESPGMHGAGMWGAVGHTSVQCVSCCRADGSEGRSRGALAAYGASCPLGSPACTAKHSNSWFAAAIGL